MADVTEKSLDDFFAKRDKKKKKEKTKTKEAIPVPAATVLVKKIKKEKEKSAKNENPDAPVEKVTRPGGTRTGVPPPSSARLMFTALNRPTGPTRVGSRGADTLQVSPRCVEPPRPGRRVAVLVGLALALAGRGSWEEGLVLGRAAIVRGSGR